MILGMKVLTYYQQLETKIISKTYMQTKVHILSCFATAHTNVPLLKHLDSSGSTYSLY